MNTLLKASVICLASTLVAACSRAPANLDSSSDSTDSSSSPPAASAPESPAVQSDAPGDRSVRQQIKKALLDAGIDPRTTSVQVITTSDHIVYLKGLISDKDEIALAGKVAAQTAPNYKIVNKINSSFFDDPNHVTGDKTK
jgi:osmotically-inducible protein OsmY